MLTEELAVSLDSLEYLSMRTAKLYVSLDVKSGQEFSCAVEPRLHP